MATTANAPAGSWFQRAAAAWDRFWFHPSDPATLGVIRIATGLLVLYVHLAYSFDLQEFFGKGGWFDAQMTTETRRDLPYVKMPTGWENLEPTLRLPEARDDRKDVIDFLKELPAAPEERKRKLRYVYELPNDPPEAIRRLTYVQFLSREPDQRERQLQLLLTRQAPRKELEEKIPPSLLDLSDEQRLQVKADILNLLACAPDTPGGRDNVMNFLLGNAVGSDARDRLLGFVEKLPADPGERQTVLKYIDHWGVDPAQAFAKGFPAWSVWFHVTDPDAVRVIHVCFLGLFVLFTIGFCTRVTSVLTWLAVVSYIQRGQQAYMFGMDTMMNILLIYLMIGPSGAAFSVDRLIARYRAMRSALREHRLAGPIDAHDGPALSSGATFAVRLIQVHFCFIYMASGLSKLKGPMWWNHTALWNAVANPEFTPLNFGWYETGLRWLCESRSVWEASMAFGVIFTFWAEIGLPFLIWTRLRPVMLVSAFLLHTGIALTLGLTGFSLFMFTLLLAYFPPSVFRSRLAAPPGLPRLRLTLDAREPAQVRAASLAHAADIWDQLEVVDRAAVGSRPVGGKEKVAAAEPAELRLSADGGPPQEGRAAYELAIRSLRLLRPFARLLLLLPGAGGFGKAADRSAATRKSPPVGVR